MTTQIQDREDLPTLRRPQEQQLWYVLVARYHKEMAVSDELRDRGFAVYIPMRYALTKSRVRQRVLKPAISGLVFVRGTLSELFDYKHSSRLCSYIFFRSRQVGRWWEPLVVSDEAMNNFMKLTALTELPLQYFHPDEIRLEKGDDVRIMDGPFTGIVGKVQQLPRRKGQYLVVEIPGVTTVVARLKPQFVEPMTTRVAPSQHVEADVKRLDEVAKDLLYRHPDGADNQLLRSTLLTELNTLRLSLATSKVIMNSDRVAYALAHLLASMATDESEELRKPYLEQLAATAPKLKSTSQLRQRAAIYLWLLNRDEAAGAFLNATLHAWNPATATAAQKTVLGEWREAKAAWGEK